MVRAWLPPDVAGRLVVTDPGVRLPLLLGLFALTAALTAIAAFQFRREQELVRLRQDFTSSVSHELRTPLTQILLFGETLELGRAGGEDARREAVSVIVQEARRLAHLVENVLHLSRAERRMVRVSPSATPLAPLLREIVERFAPLAGADAVRVRAELDEGLLALVDAEALHQIVINLLDNADQVRRPGAGHPSESRCAKGARESRSRTPGPGIPSGERTPRVGAVRSTPRAEHGARERHRPRRGTGAGDRARRRVPGRVRAAAAGRASWSSCPGAARIHAAAGERPASPEAAWPAS